MPDVAPAQEQGISQVKKGELRQRCLRCLPQLLKNQTLFALKNNLIIKEKKETRGLLLIAIDLRMTSLAFRYQFLGHKSPYQATYRRRQSLL